ncbi:MAG: glycosyltransferase family 2 protein [Williamsia sp.]|nr:glycosyltransferase family 2 protein [Williamsia sp.]
MHAPLVSVIIPNYNHAPYLAQRFETVLFQTYQAIEIIVLDDCSTDESRRIIEQYRAYRQVVHVVYNETNSGSTFKQWLKGIELCRGEYVWIAESDDWCEPSFLETVVSGMLQKENCVVGYCQSYCMEGSNQIRWQSEHPYLSDYLTGQAFVEKYMLANTAIFNASMAVWKRESFPLISQAFTRYRMCGDWLFWIELCLHGNVFVSGKLLNYFRKHGGDVSSQSLNQGEGFTEEIALFTLLRNRKVISDRHFLLAIKHSYIRYKGAGQSLPLLTRQQLNKLFFQERPVERYLRWSYRRFYIKHSIRKVFDAIVAR